MDETNTGNEMTSWGFGEPYVYHKEILAKMSGKGWKDRRIQGAPSDFFWSGPDGYMPPLLPP